MHKYLQGLFGLFGLVCWVSPATAAEDIKVEILEYGIYSSKSEVKRERNYATTTGYVRSAKEVELLEQTTNIPLNKSRLFGFKFRISGLDEADYARFHLVVKHPEMIRPNGTRSTGYDYAINLNTKSGVVENQSGYSLDKDFELVEGDWEFEYWYKGKKILGQKFTTVKAEPAGEAAAGEGDG